MPVSVLLSVQIPVIITIICTTISRISLILHKAKLRDALWNALDILQQNPL